MILEFFRQRTPRHEYHCRRRKPGMVVFWDNRLVQRPVLHDDYPRRHND